MKKLITIIVFAAVLLSCSDISCFAYSAECAVLMEAESGDIIYSENPDTRRGPASTTKIMTAIIAIENCPLDKVITVSPAAVGVEGSSVYLYAGEKITLEALLYALMLQSANDAAAAIAYEIAGGISEFAEMMNAKARELGLENTHFSNPHGLDDTDHYTTARDLAALARYALENETFARIVSTKKITIKMHGGDTSRVLVNHNRLLRTYDDIIGVKTGYTKKCGRTLVSAAERDGVRLICVTLDDGDDWRDHRAMLDAGFDKYERVCLCKKGDFDFAATVLGGESDSASVCAENDVFATLPRLRGEIKTEIFLPDTVCAPVCEGDKIGSVKFYLDGKFLAETNLIAENASGEARGGKGIWFWKK